MALTSQRPSPLQWQVFRGSDAVRRDLVSTNQLRSTAWVRVRHDVYADSRIRLDHTLACRATALRLPVTAVFAGPSAAFLHGVEHAASYNDDVHVILPPDLRLRSQHGLRIHGIDIDADEMEARDGLRRTTPARTAWDVACWLELTQAVSIIDRLLRRGQVARADLGEVVERHANHLTRSRALRVFDLTDPRSRSAAESSLRIRIVTAGLPRPVARHPIELATGRVLHPELVWPELQVAVEIEGPCAGGRSRCLDDVDPELMQRYSRGQLTAAGWTVLPVTLRQMRHGFTDFVTALRVALLDRGWQP
ncbi:hypothetical protein RB614_39795 [Phytohabitans sp. ZYX-F-186]|uniref:Transcriptional regulator, AbiEi antitoxin, Type IV TA system n=1 Tax=Phytohabitans maris TaxID=3071409 RepID=A0ABU0ZXF8_9ACTN|nr:hypothetical protein [Phytohabitans sp. ZYX-F-186]MDQ7910657.1 hypothetical protein [Phytohabitans sp. ZYX-F-186]